MIIGNNTPIEGKDLGLKQDLRIKFWFNLEPMQE
jgi:hypothetical protein